MPPDRSCTTCVRPVSQSQLSWGATFPMPSRLRALGTTSDRSRQKTLGYSGIGARQTVRTDDETWRARNAGDRLDAGGRAEPN